MSAEEWKPIAGFPDYSVSNGGRVLSRKKKVPRELRRVLNTHGYEVVNLWGSAGSAKRSVHSLVAAAFFGPRPDGLEVRHLNGVKTDNRVGNLAYGTPSENERDKVRHGTHPHASKTHCRNGHAFDAANTYVFVDLDRGWTCRTCRTCNRAAQRRLKQRRMLAAAGIERAA